MRCYPKKENHISSAVIEIIRYKQTNKQTDILLLYYKDKIKENPIGSAVSEVLRYKHTDQ